MSMHGPGPGGMRGQQAKAIDFLPSLRRLLGHLRPERAILAAVVALGVVQVAMTVVIPLLLGRATDIIFTGVLGRMLPAGLTKAESLAWLVDRGQDRLAAVVERLPVVPGQGVDLDALVRVLVVAAVAAVLGFVGGWGQGYLLNGAVQRTVRRLRATVADKLHRLPLAYFDRTARGDLISRFTNDIDNISQTLQQTLSQLLTSLLTVVGVVAMMFVVSPVLAVIALTSIPVVLLVATLIGRRAQGRFTDLWASTGDVSAHVEETFTGHDLVTTYGRRSSSLAEFDQRNDSLFRAGFRAQAISGSMMPSIMFIGNLNFVLIAVVGGLRVASGQLNLGAVQAFIQYSRMYTHPLTQIASMANLLQSGVASAERVFRVLDEEEQVPDDTGRPAPGGTGRVAFEHVDFSYSPDTELITDLSLVAEPGQTIAIVGPTGAGKTTLVNLLMRFYEVDAGRITVDGVDIRTLPRTTLRSRMGMVLQDTWLFGGTIRENIAYGRPEASEQEVAAAAEAAYVDHFVHTLPEGYDTVIDEEGSNISVGQRQLITIARAFLTDPQVLILDEATSSVDTRTEVLVQHAMAALRQDRTSFVIAHRLSTIRDAQTIVVMDHGRIVEQGRHEDLLADGGHYADLYAAQFS